MKEIAGKNIKLRKYKLSDADDIYQNVKDKDIVKWTLRIPHPYPKDGAKKFIRQTQYNYKKKKEFNYGIALLETDKIIGNVSLMKVDWKNKKAEIGYWIGKKYWSRGYMTEAVNLVLTIAFKKLKLHRVEASIFKPNKASGRVLEKSGFKLEGEMRESDYKHNKWQNRLMYSILDKEF